MKHRLPMIAIVMVLLQLACYCGAEIETNQVGALLQNNEIEQCVGPGVYHAPFDMYADIKSVGLSTVKFQVEDPEVATRDTQLVGVAITVQARRQMADVAGQPDCASISSFLTNWSGLVDDVQLIETLTATAREGIKNGTRQFTLEELLNDRNALANAISAALEEDAAKYFTEIINVTVENVDINDEYAAILNDTAALKAQEDFQSRRQALIEQTAQTDLFERQQQQIVLAEQLKVEEAQTAIDVEIAERAGEVIAAKNSVYIRNPQAFNLEQLRLLKDLFGAGTVYFIPEGTDLTSFFGMDGRFVTPVPAE